MDNMLHRQVAASVATLGVLFCLVASVSRKGDQPQGNNAGRQRMRADTTLRPPKPPRCLILSSGEEVPRGQSLRARTVITELVPFQREENGGMLFLAVAGQEQRWWEPDALSCDR